MRSVADLRHGSLRERVFPEPLRTIARSLGYDLVRADFNSPIPDLRTLSARLWTTPAPMPGVELRIAESLRLLTDDLAPYIAEYDPPDHAPGTAHGYVRVNNMYPAVDGEVMYAMLRHLKPRHVVELGAGFSSLVVSDALARNVAEGRGADRLVFDPYPSPAALSAGVEVRPVAAQDVPAEVFSDLADGDVLIIDTTHTVKAGGDVVRLLLEVLPAIADGVVVHIHDFFRPYEYPRWFYERFALYWQEHYLVQAFLIYNPVFEVLIANYALTRSHPAEVATVIRGADATPGEASGSALWLRRRGAGARGG